MLRGGRCTTLRRRGPSAVPARLASAACGTSSRRKLGCHRRGRRYASRADPVSDRGQRRVVGVDDQSPPRAAVAAPAPTATRSYPAPRSGRAGPGTIVQQDHRGWTRRTISGNAASSLSMTPISAGTPSQVSLARDALATPRTRFEPERLWATRDRGPVGCRQACGRSSSCRSSRRRQRFLVATVWRSCRAAGGRCARRPNRAPPCLRHVRDRGSPR